MSPTTTKNSDSCPENTRGLVCLPPISESLQLIWIQAESTSELDDHPQLLHTFSYFPYPTMPEIALLCLRHGLQLEKVKAWFMVQRIRCGISWTSEEIEETRSRLLYSQDQLHFKSLVTLAKKSNVFESSETMATGTSKTELEPEDSSAPVSSANGNAAPEAKRRKMDNYAFEIGQEGTEMDIEENRSHSPSNTGDHSFKYEEYSPNFNPYADSQSDLQGTSSGFVSQYNDYQEESNGRLKEYRRRHRKTKEQLTILKSFFLKCQWCAREDYKMLGDLTGLPRSEIIQWFGDTRYALKHGQLRWWREKNGGRPKWLDEPQHNVPQNGRSADSKSYGSHYLAKGSPGPEVSDTDQPTSPLPAPVVTAPIVVSDECLDLSTSKANKNVGDQWANTEHAPVGPGKTVLVKNDPYQNNLRTEESPSLPKDAQAKPKSSTSLPPKTPAKSSCEGYKVLEKYLSTHRRFKEEDFQSLAEKSGLSCEEVADWFCDKSNEPFEVEVCLDDEVEEEEGEDYDKGEEGEYYKVEAEDEEVDDLVI
uniref:Homeobox and leucine zipper encoding n=1 Tax=Leptobrachium leishanense TaxID=445787 RepID=A0A8C5PK26_9ANUR